MTYGDLIKILSKKDPERIFYSHTFLDGSQIVHFLDTEDYLNFTTDDFKEYAMKKFGEKWENFCEPDTFKDAMQQMITDYAERIEESIDYYFYKYCLKR